MDEQLRAVADKLAFHGGEVEQVKIRPGQGPHAAVRGMSRRGLDEIVSDQSVRAGDPGR